MNIKQKSGGAKPAEISFFFTLINVTGTLYLHKAAMVSTFGFFRLVTMHSMFLLTAPINKPEHAVREKKVM